MSDTEKKSVGFTLSKSMIKVVQDTDNGIVPAEGEKICGDKGEVWVKGKGRHLKIILIIRFWTQIWPRSPNIAPNHNFRPKFQFQLRFLSEISISITISEQNFNF